LPRTGGAPTRASGIVRGFGPRVKGGGGRCERNGRVRCPIIRPYPIGPFMRTRHTIVLSLASAMLSIAPSLAHAQRTFTRSCGDRYSDARGYADCRYDVERSRALQREATREQAEQRRDRARWDAIVRQARAQARTYDLAERSRQRSAERAERARVERVRIERDRVERDRVRIRRY